MTDLHLVSWNRPKMTELVIKSIHRNTKRDNFRLVVLDNGSSAETVKMLLTLHENGYIDELILLAENKGLEKARQLLLENVGTEYFVCIDNDCLPPPIDKFGNKDWLEGLTELIQKYEDFAAISMRTPFMIGTGEIFADADEVGDEILEFGHPGGSYRIMSTRAVKEVGGWFRSSPGRGSEETYICGQLHEAGYRTAFAVKIKCLHLFGTRDDNPTDRWGYDKDMKPEDSGHRDIDHPALRNGDNYEDVVLYSNKELADAYFSHS